MSGVLVIAELKDGALRGVTAEVVSAAGKVATDLGGPVHVAVCGGEGAGAEAAQAGQWGAEKVFGFESSALTEYHGSAHAAVLADHVSSGGYGVVLLAATSRGKDLGPRLAARLKVPLMTDVTGLEAVDGSLHVTRPVFAGKALARVRVEGTPQVATLRPNVFPKSEDPKTPEVEVSSPDDRPEWSRYRVTGFDASPGAALDVSEASVIVSGGRGMKGPEHWGLLEGLRDALGDSAALGASRAVVDAGWRPHGEQVGQTGKTVAPKLYFALGISGAIQHLAGMRTSQVIVAVNKDPEAPIFGVADYGIVGDLFEVVPAITERVKEIRGG